MIIRPLNYENSKWSSSLKRAVEFILLIKMTTSYNAPTKRKKSSDQEYHVTNMRRFINEGKSLMKIPNFPKNNKFFYQRPDGKGWWMPIKQLAIRSYSNLYLKILQKQEFIDTCFIDPLSNYGMIKLTKNNGKDVLIMPGTSINVALISLKKKKGFSAYFINDIDPEIRGVIKSRFETLNQFYNNSLQFNIEPPDKGKIDSNEWVINVLNNITEKYDCPNYLMVIDNQGMDIGYKTIKKIRECHEYGDLIITFHDSAFSRSMHNQEKNKFFYGCEIDKYTGIQARRSIYIKQLKSIGFGRVEEISVRSEGNFFYTLLFCCRENVGAEWLKSIKYLRETRFKYCNAKFMKHIFDIAVRRIKPLNEFCY